MSVKLAITPKKKQEKMSPPIGIQRMHAEKRRTSTPRKNQIFHKTSMPIKATKTANIDLCTYLSTCCCGAPLLLPPDVPPCPCEKPPTEPVDAEPDALDVPEPDPDPEPPPLPPPVPPPVPPPFPDPESEPESEPDPELVVDPEEPVSPLCPLVPGPAPVKPGTVATSVGVAKAREAVGILDADPDAEAFDDCACG